MNIVLLMLASLAIGNSSYPPMVSIPSIRSDIPVLQAYYGYAVKNNNRNGNFHYRRCQDCRKIKHRSGMNYSHPLIRYFQDQESCDLALVSCPHSGVFAIFTTDQNGLSILGTGMQAQKLIRCNQRRRWETRDIFNNKKTELSEVSCIEVPAVIDDSLPIESDLHLVSTTIAKILQPETISNQESNIELMKKLENESDVMSGSREDVLNRQLLEGFGSDENH